MLNFLALDERLRIRARFLAPPGITRPSHSNVG